MKEHSFRVTNKGDRAIDAHEPATAPRKPKKIKCPITGAMVFDGADQQPALTTEIVKESLTDFP